METTAEIALSLLMRWLPNRNIHLCMIICTFSSGAFLAQQRSFGSWVRDNQTVVCRLFQIVIDVFLTRTVSKGIISIKNWTKAPWWDLRLLQGPHSELDFYGTLFGLKNSVQGLSVSPATPSKAEEPRQEHSPQPPRQKAVQEDYSEHLNGSYRLSFSPQTIFGMAFCHPFSRQSPGAYSQSYDPLMLWLLPKAYWLCSSKITSLLGRDGRAFSEKWGGGGPCQNVGGQQVKSHWSMLFKRGIFSQSRWTPRQPRSSFHANRPGN